MHAARPSSCVAARRRPFRHAFGVERGCWRPRACGRRRLLCAGADCQSARRARTGRRSTSPHRPDAEGPARVEASPRRLATSPSPSSSSRCRAAPPRRKKRVNQDAFSHSSANITFEEEGTFKLGNALFRKLWVSSPSSTQASDGLGPLFNARACQSCHLKDGRGHPPEGGADATSMFLRLARAAETAEEKAAIADHDGAEFPRSGLWQAVAGPRRPRPRRRRPDGDRLRGNPGDARRRHDRFAAQADLLGRRASPTARCIRRRRCRRG